MNEKTPVTMTVLNRYYDYLREKAEKEAEDRLREVYLKIPEIKKIDDEISSIGVRLSKALALRESKEDSKAMRAKMDTLREDRAYLLAENDFDIDYTEIRYACPKCSDTGINEMGGRLAGLLDDVLEHTVVCHGVHGEPPTRTSFVRDARKQGRFPGSSRADENRREIGVSRTVLKRLLHVAKHLVSPGHDKGDHAKCRGEGVPCSHVGHLLTDDRCGIASFDHFCGFRLILQVSTFFAVFDLPL